MLAYGQSELSWSITRSPHFEVFSQSGELRGNTAALRLEQLRSLFELAGIKPHSDSPVRVIGFQSAEEYEAYRLRPLADAFFVASGVRSYLVLPSLKATDFGIAAHEYTHEVMHSNGLRLPLWLNEGLAEYFSSVQIGDQRSTVGGLLPERMQTLQSSRWIGLADLLDRPTSQSVEEDRANAEIFYAESWALTAMLESAEYRSRLPELIHLVNAAVTNGPSSQVLVTVYGRSLEDLSADLHRWVEEQRFETVSLPGVKATGVKAAEVNAESMGETSALSEGQSELVMADLLVAMGATDRARKAIDSLPVGFSSEPDVLGMKGSLAYQKGDLQSARRYWSQAFHAGIRDADLCFRYAILAESQGAPAGEIRNALERAVRVRPDFDDARYKLALIEFNEGNCGGALAQLQGIRSIRPDQAYNYWVVATFAALQTGNRKQATQAAEQARNCAGTSAERLQATQLLSISERGGDIRGTRDGSGHTGVTVKS